MNDAPLLFSNFHIGREGTVCVCVWGGGGGGERVRESLREFCTLTCNPICKHTLQRDYRERATGSHSRVWDVYG